MLLNVQLVLRMISLHVTMLLYYWHKYSVIFARFTNKHLVPFLYIFKSASDRDNRVTVVQLSFTVLMKFLNVLCNMCVKSF